MDNNTATEDILGTLIVGASLLSGNAALMTTVNGIGVNWSPESLSDFWRATTPPIHPNSPLTRAYERALRHATISLRKQYQAQYGRQHDLVAFELISASVTSVAQAKCPSGMGGANTVQHELVRSLHSLLNGRDEQQVTWLKDRLLEQTALAFQQELANDIEACTLFHSWLTKEIANTPIDLSRLLQEFPRVISQIRNPTVLLNGVDDATLYLEHMLKQLRQELRSIAARQIVEQLTEHMHTQTITGNEQVELSITGDIHGPVTHMQQSGGVNFGSGNIMGNIGDIVAGDKVSGDKILGDKVLGNKTAYYGSGKSPDAKPHHIQRLIDLHIQRLRVLEEQAARAGYNTRPEVITEIDDLRTEIAKLEVLLKDST